MFFHAFHLSFVELSVFFDEVFYFLALFRGKFIHLSFNAFFSFSTPFAHCFLAFFRRHFLPSFATSFSFSFHCFRFFFSHIFRTSESAFFRMTALEAVLRIFMTMFFDVAVILVLEDSVNSFAHGRFCRSFTCESCVCTEGGEYGCCQ